MSEGSSIYLKLVTVQKKIGAIKRDKKNPFYNSSYFDINSLLEVVKPVLNEIGLLLSQPLHAEGHNVLRTTITDSETGEELTSSCRLPDIDDPQKFGSALTYYRRYAIQSLLCLEAEDDDANRTTTKPQPKESANAWAKTAEKEEHKCKTCGAKAKRKYGVSKINKQFNGIFCDSDSKHIEWLSINQAEMLPF